MAKIKDISMVLKRINTLLNQIDFENLNYGEVKVGENEFYFEKESEIQEIEDLLIEMKRQLKLSKEENLSKAITTKMFDAIQQEGKESATIKKLFNTDEEEKDFSTNQNTDKETSSDNQDSKNEFSEEENQN